MTQASSFRKLVKKQIPFKLNEFFSNTATPTNTLTSTSVTMDLPGLRKFLALDAIAQPDLWVPTESTAEVMRWRLSVRYGVLPSYRSTSSGSNCAPEVSYGTPIMFRFYPVTSTATTLRRCCRRHLTNRFRRHRSAIAVRFGVHESLCPEGFLTNERGMSALYWEFFQLFAVARWAYWLWMSSKLLVWEKILRCFLKTNFVQKELSFSFIKAILLERNFKKGLWA